MDLAKFELQKSKTTAEIEEAAVGYKKTVEIFDGCCSMAIKEVVNLPRLQELHGEALITILTIHREFHHLMATSLQEFK